jgi:hypothetical protein
MTDGTDTSLSRFSFLVQGGARAGRRAALCRMQPQALARGVRRKRRSPRGARLQECR